MGGNEITGVGGARPLRACGSWWKRRRRKKRKRVRVLCMLWPPKDR